MPDEEVPLNFEEARRAGHEDAVATAETAPGHPLLRIAWAKGFGQVDQLQTAVDDARGAGFTWQHIAEATGENWRTAATKYGSGYERMKRYRQRKQAENPE